MASESKLKRVFNSKPFLFLAILLLVWVVISTVKVSYRKYLVRQEVEKLKTEINSLQQNNQQLLEQIQYLQSEAFLEEGARQKLNLQKEGEKLIIVPDVASQSEQLPGGQPLDEAQSDNKKESFWWKWWRYFFE